MIDKNWHYCLSVDLSIDSFILFQALDLHDDDNHDIPLLHVRLLTDRCYQMLCYFTIQLTAWTLKILLKNCI